MKGPGIYHNVSLLEYIAHPGIRQSTLKHFGRASSPAHYKDEVNNPREETVAIRLGQFVDAAIFYPDRLDKDFALWPGERRGKPWELFKEANKWKTILNDPETERAIGTKAALLAHADVQRLLTSCDKQVMVVAQHPTQDCLMKSLLDLMPRDDADESLKDWLFDIKSSEDASNSGFSRIAATLGYHHQAFSYLKALELNGRTINNFAFIVAETNPPHYIHTHYFQRGDRELTKAEEDYELWLERYLKCLKSNTWPAYGDWNHLSLPPWALKKADV